MMDLATEACESCHKDSQALNESEIAVLLKSLPAWEIVHVDGVPTLQRDFKFKNFVEALAFTNNVGELAEARNHHPDILTAWGRVHLTWYTHAISGLHRNDFRCAAASDQLFN
ncbi:4a-hydroxytetrahydrobiopterin dehydratase [Neptuniibacter sp. QD57_21]|uniref:4a-hydroxytetrahydrobiopterin dehydratase n=1 Tax=Neptuniibacter sp. QD57_21 TaxID=3398213 RepID=UPI0039F4A021